MHVLRVIAATGMVLLAGACAKPPPPSGPEQAALQSVSRAIAEGRIEAGCIGKDERTCAATIALIAPLAPLDPVTKAVLEPETLDVNGRPAKREKRLRVALPLPDGLRAYAPNLDTMYLKLVFDQNRLIEGVEVDFHFDPLYAKTAEEYELSGLYEAIAGVAYPQCGKLSRLEIYRTYENKIKPVYGPRTRLEGDAHINTRETPQIGLCGLTFVFSSVTGARHRGAFQGGGVYITR